jgi:hypothetical protein
MPPIRLSPADAAPRAASTFCARGCHCSGSNDSCKYCCKMQQGPSRAHPWGSASQLLGRLPSLSSQLPHARRSWLSSTPDGGQVRGLRRRTSSSLDPDPRRPPPRRLSRPPPAAPGDDLRAEEEQGHPTQIRSPSSSRLLAPGGRGPSSARGDGLQRRPSPRRRLATAAGHQRRRSGRRRTRPPAEELGGARGGARRCSEELELGIRGPVALDLRQRISPTSSSIRDRDALLPRFVAATDLLLDGARPPPSPAASSASGSDSGDLRSIPTPAGWREHNCLVGCAKGVLSPAA